MRFAKTVVFHFLSIVISVTLTVGVVLLGLKIFDVYLLSSRHAVTPDDDAGAAPIWISPCLSFARVPGHRGISA
jgi:hypothetical protein